MKKALLGFFILLTFGSFGQDISFSEVAYKSWSEEERQMKMFSLFEGEVPTDDQLMKLITRLDEVGALDVNMRSKNRKRSIFDACLEKGRYETARLLIDKGYKINQRCFECNGETPLLKAIYTSGTLDEPDSLLGELMVFMLEEGADPDLRDMKGYTSLHWVIKNNDVMAFEVLMRPEVKLNPQLGTLKGKSYLFFFDKHWDEDEYREILVEKTELKYPPTNKEIKEKQKAAKEKAKGKAKESKKKKDQSI